MKYKAATELLENIIVDIVNENGGILAYSYV